MLNLLHLLKEPLTTEMKSLAKSTLVPDYLCICIDNYKSCTCAFPCHIYLTGIIGNESEVYSLGEGYFHTITLTPSSYLSIYCYYLHHLSSTFIKDGEIWKTAID